MERVSKASSETTIDVDSIVVSDDILTGHESKAPPDIFSGLPELDYHFPVQETIFDALPPMDFTANHDELLYNPYVDLVSNINTTAAANGDFLYEGGSKLHEGWNNDALVLMDSFENTDQNQQVQPKSLICYEKELDGKSDENVGGGARLMESGAAAAAAEGGLVLQQKECNNNITNTKMLSREVISRYFYMPIIQAAKELNVGTTFLKKKCREFGIKRWPNRKLNSLQTLISSVQEIGKQEGDEENDLVEEAVEQLEQQKKQMEEAPDMEMEKRTRKLREVCLKANYKKRKTSNNMINGEGDKLKMIKTAEGDDHSCNYNPCVVDDHQASSSTAAAALTSAYEHYYLTWPGAENI